jgi:subtilisin family serine protease
VATTILFLIFVLSPLGASAVGPSTLATRWIVQVRSASDVSDVATVARARWGIVTGQRFGTVLHGFAASLTPTQRVALAADPGVEAIVPDFEIQATGDPYPVTTDEIQPGARRVRATDNSDRGAASLDVDIAVLDTGVQPDNAELNIAGGYDCTHPSETEDERAQPQHWADYAGFGHGTHVSGIAAAIENGRGVAGVAQGARLWAIKVLNGGGNGYWSWVICGLDHVAAMRDPRDASMPRIEVVNMSIASPGVDDGDCGNSNADLLHQAICRVADAGITMVAAAGNEATDASGYVPGAYDELITVAAMADWNGAADGTDPPPAPGTPPVECTHGDGDDAFATFSNYGADIDLIAPGVCVLSTLPVDRLGLMSGTSMATPHVTGGAALYYLEEARLGRPRPTPQQVRAALVAKGTSDWQTLTDPDRGWPDSVREPALNVNSFDSLPASFTIGARRAIVRTAVGAHLSNGVWLAPLGGFAATVDWAINPGTLPNDSSASFTDRTANGASLEIDIGADATPGAYEVSINATHNGDIAHATFTLIVYGATVDASGPVVMLKPGGQAGQILLPVRVTWPAIAGATRYELQQNVDAQGWATIAKPTRTSLSTAVSPGRRYQFRIRAQVDAVWREWQIGPSSAADASEPATDLVTHGPWEDAPIKRAYSERPQMSSDGGASAAYQFTGRSVAWMSSRAPDRGKAQVWIDGALDATINLYASSKANRLFVYTRSWPGANAHTIKIVVLGKPSSRPRVDIDSIVVVSD